MILSKRQRESIVLSTRRINVWHGAVRSGKTIASLLRFVKFTAEAPDGLLAIVGKTERTVYNNILRPLTWLLGDAVTINVGRHICTILGRECAIYGANDMKSEGKIRGLTLAGVYGDEVTLWPKDFFYMLLSRCSPQGAKVFITTNPDSPYHWLKKEFLDRRNELDIVDFCFSLDDNPALSPAYIEAIKREYRGLWYRRYILGEWCIAEGAIYDFWRDEPPYVIDDDGVDKVEGKEYLYVGVDYGAANPTVYVLISYMPGRSPMLVAIDEYYYDGRESGTKTDEELACDMVQWLGGRVPEAVVIDPSARGFGATLLSKNLPVIQADNSVLDGIRTQQRLLQSGQYAVLRKCVHTRREYSTYVWDTAAQRVGKDAPLKQHDHTKDAERYVLHTIFGANHGGII